MSDSDNDSNSNTSTASSNTSTASSVDDVRLSDFDNLVTSKNGRKCTFDLYVCYFKLIEGSPSNFPSRIDCPWESCTDPDGIEIDVGIEGKSPTGPDRDSGIYVVVCDEVIRGEGAIRGNEVFVTEPSEWKKKTFGEMLAYMEMTHSYGFYIREY